MILVNESQDRFVYTCVYDLSMGILKGIKW